MLHLTNLPATAQQVTQEWELRYDSAIPTFESGALSAVDAAGNAYVAGNSRINPQGSPNSYDGYVIAKFNPSGEVLWQHRFPFFQYPHAVKNVALDETGFYVVTSTVDMGSRTMVDVIKYALADGKQVWRQSETPFSTMTGIQVLADNRGGVILVGSGHFTMPGDFTQLFKYNATTGQRAWRQSLSGSVAPNVFQQMADIALDSQGDIYLTGSTGIDQNASQMLTTKRSGADGSLVWQMQYDTNLQDRAAQLAVDEAGGVYAWSIHYASDPDQPSTNTLLKYDAATGRQVWLHSMAGSAIPEQLLADEAGGLYLRSSSQGQNRLARHSASTGSQSWSSTFAGRSIDMVADEAGNLYLGSRQDSAAYTVRRYDASRGNVAWTYTSPADSTYLLQGMALSEAGTLHLTGTTGTDETHLFAASLQTTTGALVYNLTFLQTFSGIDLPTNMVTDDAGNIYMTVSTGTDDAGNRNLHTVLLKYSAAGDLLWSRQFDNSSTGVDTRHLAVDPTGTAYVMVQASRGNAQPDIMLYKVDGATGEALWETTHGPTEANVGREIRLDLQGNIYLMGTTRLQPDVATEDFLLKINPDTGASIWTKRYGRFDPNNVLNELVAFALDEAGEVYVTGTAPGPGIVNNLVLIKYASGDGRELWQEIYNSGNRQTLHRVSGLAVDNTGGVYLAAFDDLDTGERVSYLLKFAASNGALVWRQPMTDQGTTPTSLENLMVDNAGGAYVTCFINGKAHVVKFSTEAPGVVWASPYDGVLSELVLDQQGGIYVTGWNTDGVQQVLRTVKLLTSDGSKVWEEMKPVHSGDGLLAVDADRNVIVARIVYDPDTKQDVLLVKYTQSTEEPCAIPVNVQLYLAPYAIRAGWEARTTADFSPHILNEDTGLSWTWGDGSEPTMSYTAFGTSRITGKHTYTQAGIYQVGLDFSESCLKAANNDYNQWHVIYDPEAGHVKGSGSIALADFGLGGNNQKLEAEFSFFVRYQNKHATRPQGTVQLTVNKQKFSQSGALDWLVITGNQAIWKGTARLQGIGRFGYIVSVRDAGGKGKNDPNDQLRIRIWDMDRGNDLVFDNFEAGGDIYYLSQETGPRIGRGNIEINGRKDNRDLLATNGKGIQGIASAELLAYPNPAHALTTIRFTADVESAYEVQLFDLKGARVQQARQGLAKAGEVTEVQLDVSGLKDGMYLARITSGGKVKSVKIMVKR
ncbi:PQQ-binding-like beta-propeller repeat protein [Pontibacter indicus]|uniref:outer membrane protein assembly factor BamB family protein n=1 Tax=Pontibacter indicus TaxID=1317125 RepID=UPI000978C118|nr:PQQ-binding-like beta-propeller repeat protein [Pontibacter indicus]